MNIMNYRQSIINAMLKFLFFILKSPFLILKSPFLILKSILTSDKVYSPNSHETVLIQIQYTDGRWGD